MRDPCPFGLAAVKPAGSGSARGLAALPSRRAPKNYRLRSQSLGRLVAGGESLKQACLAACMRQ